MGFISSDYCSWYSVLMRPPHNGTPYFNVVLVWLKFSGPLVLLGSYIICQNSVPLMPGRRHEVCHIFIIPHEHITKTCLFKIYWKSYHQKWKISDKKFWYFSYFCSKLRLWVLVLKEYPQSMFLSRNKKNNAYPCKAQFYYIKVGFKGGQNYIGMFLWWDSVKPTAIVSYWFVLYFQRIPTLEYLVNP